ncbi:MAG: hypothetical protein HFI36_00850 [Bacilli bacterium]|jgi:putative Mn2+ efflux pump MntP|nr:hypothetical protein [Bacilli bacterium]MCX4253647.1 manganese efflux pump [Bacilli bacterium]
MKEIFSIFLIGIALSMDTFSLSLTIGMFDTSNRKALKLALIVGIMHFVMPFIGMILGDELIHLLGLKCDILLGFILLFIAIQIIIDIIKKKEEQFNLNLLGMIFFAIGVSLDSFSVGLGLRAITSNIYIAMVIFAGCSFLFTFTGVIVGRYANKILGMYANIVGALILIILGLMHLL